MSLARINPIKGSQFCAYRSRLWRQAQKVPRPPTTPFAKLWKPLFMMLRVLCNMVVQKPGICDTTVEMFFNAVVVPREEDICCVKIVTSPTSPKPRPTAGNQSAPRPPQTVSLDLAARGLGPAGCVAIPDVQLPRTKVTPVVAAMT